MLVSRLFRSNAALQACATQDQAHILLGSRGEAVALIQRALVALVSADISEDEIRARVFGRTTEREVLKYKTDRAIINFAYQTKADAIVGKMTIAELDRDMATREAVSPLANVGKSGEVL